MDTCLCAPASLTSVTFARGVVMLRCAAHDLQSWFIDGGRTDAGTARLLLADLFVETRGQRRRSTSPVPVGRVVHLPLPPQDEPSTEVALDAGADEKLTALLNSRGLQGSWAVA